MGIVNIDHFVITTSDIKSCLHFYVDILGMRCCRKDGRYALYFGNQKINVHTRKAEFLPAARNPEYGSQDFCLVVEEDINDVMTEIKEKGYPIEMGPVSRTGAKGEIISIYLRDPDGNLVELSNYR